jgi:hypothetical protein
MSMRPFVRHVLKAYRPLYLHGLLRDGQYRPPTATAPDDPAAFAPSSGSRRRTLLAALAGLQHGIFHHRSKS